MGKAGQRTHEAGKITVLTIAGSDSGGGAGIQADLRTFQHYGLHGASVITAVTAQNAAGVRAWEPVSATLVAQQIDAVAVEKPAAVKSGMLGTAPVAGAVADALRRHRLPNYVLDPVMVASSGARLLDADAATVMKERLVPLADLVTPNLDEAEALVGGSVRSPERMEEAGRALLALGAKAALIKGGHLAGDELVDVLVTARSVRRFTHRRIAAHSTHGTGCALSAAIAAGLALGRDLEAAVREATLFLQQTIS